MTEVSILVLLSFTASSFNLFFFRFLWFEDLAGWLLQFLMHCCGHYHLVHGFMSACKMFQLGVGGCLGTWFLFAEAARPGVGIVAGNTITHYLHCWFWCCGFLITRSF